MSRHRALAVCSISIVLVSAFFSVLMAARPQQATWKDVNDAIAKGLPKTAIEKLGPIIERATESGSHAEAIKAIGMKIALEGNVQGNKPEERVTRMKAEIAGAPEPMKPVMRAILANWYWHYFQQNSWRFMQRTRTSSAPSDDFTTWDLPRILAEIDKHFTESLNDAEALQAIPIAEYDDLFEKGNAPDSYRPTVYDVIAYNALDFYLAGEQAGARSQDAFDLSAESPVFDSGEAFLGWEPESDDDNSSMLKAIRLIQQVAEFHADDDDPSARLDIELFRYRFGNSHAFGEEKTNRFKSALTRFIRENEDHPISARAIHQLASTIHAENDFVKARATAQTGLTKFPESIGASRCYNLIQQIEAKELHVTADRAWSNDQPSINIQYRNIDKVHFRLVPYDFDNYVKSNRWGPEQLDRNQQLALLRLKPIHSWEVSVPVTEDYKQRVERVSPPDDLPAGSYYLIASHADDFSEQNNVVGYCEVWVTKLAIVLRGRNYEDMSDGFVLDAESGDPIAGAVVKGWQRDNQGKFHPIKSTKTDRNGKFEFPLAQRASLFLATHKGESFASINHVQGYGRGSRYRVQEQTMFFTDRSLYRPGQTIRYKGICYSYDQKENNYRTIGARNLTVVFADVNGKEIERQTHRTNEYGSFNGSVTAPRDRLTGQMSIRVENAPPGSASFSVEEYKRPKFRVAVDRPEKAARLGDTVKVKGTATAYTGAAINDAKVRWRVVREVRYPDWWFWRCWWMPPQSGNSQEIAHGTTVTDAGGAFSVEFGAKPDVKVPQESEPTFRYTVYADVTDTAGETRSASQTVSVGYTALSAKMTAANWLTEDEPVDIRVRTTTLNGVDQPAKGTIKIYSLKQPEKVRRPALSGNRYYYNYGIGFGQPPAPDPANIHSWELDKLVLETEFATDASGATTIAAELAAGPYRAKLESADRFGKQVTAMLPLQVYAPDAPKLAIKIPHLFAAPDWRAAPGEDFTALWGSGYDRARAFVEVEHRGKVIQSYWTDPKQTQKVIRQKVSEPMRGGFHIRTTMVRENRAHLESRYVDVPWDNKRLKLHWEHFVSKLEPAQKETWTAVIKGPDAEASVAEMVATLYDASLDAYRGHYWSGAFSGFYRDNSTVRSMFENTNKNLNYMFHNWRVSFRGQTLTYRHFPASIIQSMQGYGYFGDTTVMEMQMDGAMAPALARSAAPAMNRRNMRFSQVGSELSSGMGGMAADKKAIYSARPERRVQQAAAQAPTPDLENVSARKNLNETAFFFPHLVSKKDGTVRMEFTMPEALTEWKFMGFAHDQQLRGGSLSGTTVTAKELMVQPNPPRFLREGDAIEFTVKVSNESPTNQSGHVRLTFANATTSKSVDQALANVETDKAFDIAAGQSQTLSWKLDVPDGIGFLTYKAVGSTGRLSDGEEGYLPVLSRRILVRESLPLPIRGKQTKDFRFEKLLASADSQSLKHQSLTVQVVSNPSWYAVMALPYLMEYPHECTEQTFNRMYANSLARHIAMSDPKIARVFEQWRATPALDSPMEKNEDLKAVMLAETPWYRQAKSESQARRNVGILFDNNRLDRETARTLRKLTEMQLPDGAWPWFPGGGANDYVTLYITTGFGRMRHLGVDIDTAAAIKAVGRLDQWMTKRYNQIRPEDRGHNHLSTTVAFYLYGRSFFLKDQAVAPQHREAFNYWVGQAKKYWLQLSHRQSQAHLAVALHRLGSRENARGIMQSIHERSVSDKELGMFWRDTELSWWWYRAPIETQAMMIEAFDEVMDDRVAVEDCKVWLLKQKQTQDWKTTKATADAVYALLLRGSDLLASNELVQVDLGGETIEAANVEAGTGFYEHRDVGAAVSAKQGEITVSKVDDGVAWASVHWQYLEDIANVTPHEATPLTLTKQLHRKVNTAKGPTLVPVEGPIGVGDELVVRIVLRTDRDMEYVHLKDHRGSGTEPTNVLSRYKYQDGLGYYESTKDTASHFFIDYLPKGTYVFEYSTRVQLKGEYQTGVASVQCMYAPEFNSHSESLPIVVK